MAFGLSLPPIVVILLLVFVWVIVFVLLVWYLLPWGERSDETENPARARRRGEVSGLERPKVVRDEPNSPRPPRVQVREVPSDETRDEREPNTRDAFEEYGRAGRRRDDLDF